jgi:23S rRNA (guanosine2251-2'-O)-methyltransferase
MKTEIFVGRNVLKEAILAKASIKEIYMANASAYEFAQSLKALKSMELTWTEGLPPSVKNENHQGIAFRAAHRFYVPPSGDLLKDQTLIVLAHQMQDVHNLGSIARSLAGFGGGLIIHDRKAAAQVSPAVVKASAGLAFRLKFSMTDSMAETITFVKSAGFEVLALEASRDAEILFECAPKQKVALLLGSEGSGLSRDMTALAHRKIKIPTEPILESLNVGHAAAIAMAWVYEGRRVKR